MVRGGGLGRRVEDGERRHHLDAALRRAGVLLDRLRDHRPDEPPRDLGGHGRERGRPARRLRRRRLPQPRRGGELGEPRPQGLAAHLEDRRPPGEAGRRLGRGAGPALVEGRRPGAVQDDGRREDVGEGPRGGGVDGRHRRRDRPAEPRRPLRRDLAAPPHGGRVHGWRAGVGPPSLDRRRRDLGEAEEGPARGPARQDRPRALAAGPGRPVRRHRDEPPQGGRLPLDRPRLVVGEAIGDRLRRDRAALLPGALREPPRRGPHLPRGRADAGLGRRGEDLPADGGEGQALRQPLARVPQGRPRLPSRGHRRRDLRELRPREDLALRGEPAGHAVLQGGGGRRGAVLHGLRGHPGQQHAGRAVAHRQRQRHHERRLVHHALRRRAPAGHRARQPERHVLGVAAGEPRAGRPHDGGARLRPAPARAGGSPRPLQLGRPDPGEPPLAEAPLLRLAAGVALRRPRRPLASGLGGPHPEPGPHDPPLHGPAVELGLAVGHGRDVELQHDHVARRVAEGGGPALRRAPTTGSSRCREDGGTSWRKVEAGSLPGRARERLRQRREGGPPRRGHRLRRARRPQVRRLPARTS